MIEQLDYYFLLFSHASCFVSIIQPMAYATTKTPNLRSVEPENVKEFRRWFIKHGGRIHDAVYFGADNTGMSVNTEVDLPPGTSVISCPFGLVITDELARTAITEAFDLATTDALKDLSERQVLCAYLSMHWIEIKSDTRLGCLKHRPYIAVLPSPSSLLTPLYLNASELALFEGTNLHTATSMQMRMWKGEWSRLQEVLSSFTTKCDIAEQIQWEFYLAASTYITSRAFPSTILSETPSLVATPSSYPVLIPGVDSLNHRRAQAVTWSVDDISQSGSDKSEQDSIRSSELAITLILDKPQAAGSELFNNYGPKPNASFILAYGFSVPDNPDDTILLSIGAGMGSTPAAASEAKTDLAKSAHEVGRNAKGAEKLWDDVRQRVVEVDERDSNRNELGDVNDEDAETVRIVHSLEIDMRTAALLAGMIFQRQAKLPLHHESPDVPFGVRPAVYAMWKDYVKGQHEVLQDLEKWVRKKDEDAVMKAQEMGVAIEDGKDEDEGEDEDE